MTYLFTRRGPTYFSSRSTTTPEHKLHTASASANLMRDLQSDHRINQLQLISAVSTLECNKTVITDIFYSFCTMHHNMPMLKLKK